MTFIEYANKMRNPLAGATDEDIAALSKELSSTYTENCCFHEMNNAFIDLTFGKTILNLHTQEYSFYGVSPAPYPRNGQNYAVIFEDHNFYDKYWCHVSEKIVNMWKEQVKSNGHA